MVAWWVASGGSVSFYEAVSFQFNVSRRVSLLGQGPFRFGNGVMLSRSGRSSLVLMRGGRAAGETRNRQGQKCFGD